MFTPESTSQIVLMLSMPGRRPPVADDGNERSPTVKYSSARQMRLWRLDRIVSIDLIDRSFKRREDFDLAAYAARSFGVFQEDPIDVVLRFTPEATEDAARWLFHPSQRVEQRHIPKLMAANT
jgi:hypothetical protein